MLAGAAVAAFPYAFKGIAERNGRAVTLSGGIPAFHSLSGCPQGRTVGRAAEFPDSHCVVPHIRHTFIFIAPENFHISGGCIVNKYLCH